MSILQNIGAKIQTSPCDMDRSTFLQLSFLIIWAIVSNLVVDANQLSSEFRHIKRASFFRPQNFYIDFNLGTCVVFPWWKPDGFEELLGGTGGKRFLNEGSFICPPGKSFSFFYLSCPLDIWLLQTPLVQRKETLDLSCFSKYRSNDDNLVSGCAPVLSWKKAYQVETLHIIWTPFFVQV